MIRLMRLHLLDCPVTRLLRGPGFHQAHRTCVVLKYHSFSTALNGWVNIEGGTYQDMAAVYELKSRNILCCFTILKHFPRTGPDRLYLMSDDFFSSCFSLVV